MTIDANLLMGLQIGFAVGVVVGIIGTVVILLLAGVALRNTNRAIHGKD